MRNSMLSPFIRKCYPTSRALSPISNIEKHMEHIYQFATVFRAAIEKIPQTKFNTSLGFSNFPHACCDDASLLLAAYLSDNGFSESTRIHGVNGGLNKEINSHVWLEHSGFIIDITADQFAAYHASPVIVTKQSDFHKNFEVESQEIADFRIKFANDLSCLPNFSRDYAAILREI